MLNQFLEKKPLYYDVIDYGRMPRIYEKIKDKIELPKIIHLIGTNGKGTTGRFLATALYAKGFRVGHYTSPHILEFNERIWLDGQNVSTQTLNAAHQILLELLTEDDANALSYFEYTTLLAMLVYQECDYVVLEAGLGGEYDATAVFENILTLVTPIDFDHEAFLGSTLEAIAKTKLNAVKSAAILARQKHKEVYAVAQKIAREKELTIEGYEKYLNEDDLQKIRLIAENMDLAEYLKENLALAVAALRFFKIDYCEQDFSNARLFGRLSRVAKNIWLDVGHNPLAASSIAHALKGRKYTLVYNSYKDKGYKDILRILQPVTQEVQIIDIDEERIVEKRLLEESLELLGIAWSDFVHIDESKEYLVFGSFSVAENFLKRYHNG